MDPFVDLDFSRVNVPCPGCGKRLDADAVGGYFLRCRDQVCGWKGSLLDLRIQEKCEGCTHKGQGTPIRPNGEKKE